MFRYLIFFFVLLTSDTVKSQAYLNSISSFDEFTLLAGRPLVEKYGRVSAVKIVYDRRSGDLYFVNNEYYRYHHEFCQNVLNNTVELDVFNVLNYSNDEHRPYLLANINYFESSKSYVLELSPVDIMRNEWIVELYQKTAQAFFAKKKLKFFLNNLRLQNNRQNLANKIPLIDPSEIYKGLIYQPISRKEAYGILRFVEDSMPNWKAFHENDILIVKETPLFLPNVAGVMVATFQTPLSHLNILGQNRGIPICAYTDAFTNPQLRRLEGKPVHYIVKSDNYSILPGSTSKLPKKQNKKIELSMDLKVDSLVDISKLGKNGRSYCGNKAYHFSLLYQLSKKGKFKTPEAAFVIPFYFYHQHLKQSGADIMIDDLLGQSNALSDSALRFELEKIRNQILKTPLDASLSQAVQHKMKSFGTYTQFRFRSSTNAEDASGFSGAGLYESKTGILNHLDKTADKAILKVWASLWNEEAFFERAYYGIDQQKTMMGILVHRSFPDEKVNGVVITKNLYRPNYYGFVVNAQLGDESVVKPKSGLTADQFICFPRKQEAINYGNKTIDILTTSDLNQHQLVMTELEIQRLADECEKIKAYFFKHAKTRKSYFDFGLDLEFKLDGASRTLYIKQVRMFND